MNYQVVIAFEKFVSVGFEVKGVEVNKSHVAFQKVFVEKHIIFSHLAIEAT